MRWRAARGLRATASHSAIREAPQALRGQVKRTAQIYLNLIVLLIRVKSRCTACALKERLNVVLLRRRETNDHHIYGVDHLSYYRGYCRRYWRTDCRTTRARWHHRRYHRRVYRHFSSCGSVPFSHWRRAYPE